MAVKQFGETWWGEAWLDALENRALIDPNRLPRGRTYARKGLVLNPEIEPGLLAAEVEGTDVYRTSLGVRRLTDEEWDELLDRVTTQAKLAAALLAGEVPHELHDLLLPGSGDLNPDCSCPDWAEPCKHAAALCYVAADLFDSDPFALLLLRGRGRDQVLTELRRRRAIALGVSDADGRVSHRPRGSDPGINAADAYRRWRTMAAAESTPTPPSVPVPGRARHMPRLSVAPPADSGIDEMELRALAADGARRAAAMLAGEGLSALSLTVGADVARRAIDGDVESIAAATGLPADELAAAAQAFKHGGVAGMTVARGRWDAPAEQLQSGVAALTDWVRRTSGGASGGDANPNVSKPRVVSRANTVSAGAVQLRLDEDGIWWRFATDDMLGWVLVAPGSADPAELL